MKYRIEMPQFEKEGGVEKESQHETQENMEHLYTNTEAAINNFRNALTHGLKNIAGLREEVETVSKVERYFEYKSSQDDDIWTRVRILNKLITLSSVYNDSGIGNNLSEDDGYHIASVLGEISGNGLRMLREMMDDIDKKIVEKEYTSEHLALLKIALELRLYEGNIADIMGSMEFISRHYTVVAEMPRNKEQEEGRKGLFSMFFDRKKFEAHLAQEFELEKPLTEDEWLWCRAKLEYFLDGYGLKSIDVLDAWEDGGSVNGNMRMVQSLEKEKPGIVGELYRSFGIRNFYRYPREMLLDQYEKRDVAIPYGMMINPVNDHNKAFAGNNQQWAHLYNKLKDFGYGLRVVECKSKNEIARRLLQFDKKYGEEHKIDFAFIGGHGTQETIQFGDEGSHDRFILNIKDLAGSGVKKTKHFFSEHPTIMLNSCSTGGEREGGEVDDDKEGIGQKLSRMLDGHVIAPAVPVAMQSVNVMRDKDGLNFNLTYSEKDARRDFVSGVAVKDNWIKK